MENPFIFRDPEEMQNTFTERYELVDVDVLIEQLEDHHIFSPVSSA